MKSVRRILLTLAMIGASVEASVTKCYECTGDCVNPTEQICDPERIPPSGGIPGIDDPFGPGIYGRESGGDQHHVSDNSTNQKEASAKSRHQPDHLANGLTPDEVEKLRKLLKALQRNGLLRRRLEGRQGGGSGGYPGGGLDGLGGLPGDEFDGLGGLPGNGLDGLYGGGGLGGLGGLQNLLETIEGLQNGETLTPEKIKSLVRATGYHCFKKVSTLGSETTITKMCAIGPAEDLCCLTETQDETTCSCTTNLCNGATLPKSIPFLGLLCVCLLLFY